MIKTILVDDEPRSTEVLRELLTELFPELHILGDADSAESAYRLITVQKPDLIFLDVAMPDESGFDLLRKLPDLDMEVIFVTGFNQFAIDAIKFCAIGYVLKPIRREELIEAVNRAKKQIESREEGNRNKQLIHNLLNPGNPQNRIGLPTSDGIEFVSINEIIRCEGIQGCTKAIFRHRKPLISSYNLGEFRQLLENYGFFSVHKSHLVNLSHIQRYDNEGFVTMSDGEKVPVARRKRTEFMQQLRRL